MRQSRPLLGVLVLLTALCTAASAQKDGGTMGAANRAAGAILQERMKRDRPDDYRLLTRVRESEVVVVRGVYDHVESVLDAVRVPHMTIDPETLDRAELNAGQLLIIDCPGRISERAIEKVRKFVSAGGFLFTTDWCLQNVLERAFPGFVEYTRKPTRDDVVEVRVLKKDDHFLQHVQSTGDRPKWWLENSSYPIRILDRRRVEVLMESDEMSRKYGQSPIAIAFHYGDGQVLHIVSHYYLQRTETRNARERAAGGGFAGGLGITLKGTAALDAAKAPAGAIKDAYASSQFSANIVVEKQKQNAELRKVYTHRMKETSTLRISPSDGSGRAGEAKSGTPVKIVQRQAGWVKVQAYTGDVGWIVESKIEKR